MFHKSTATQHLTSSVKEYLQPDSEQVSLIGQVGEPHSVILAVALACIVLESLPPKVKFVRTIQLEPWRRESHQDR